jgi:hypothetical protein
MSPSALATHLIKPARQAGWKTEARVRLIAGCLVLASLALARLDERWLWLTAFVGANLLQSGVTGWCLLSNLLTLGRSVEPAARA